MQATTIKIHENTKSELDKFREHKSETYDEVLKKMIYIANTCKKQPKLSQETILQIEKARQRILQGNFVSEEEAKEARLVIYKIIFDEKAIEYLEKLPKDLKTRIFNKIISTKDNPFHYFKKLDSRPEYKLRVGDYRVIGDINKAEIRILILKIGHRKNVYD